MEGKATDDPDSILYDNEPLTELNILIYPSPHPAAKNFPSGENRRQNISLVLSDIVKRGDRR